MAIKTINGILKEDSTKTIAEFNTQIQTACDNAETLDTDNNYVGLVFNLKDKRIDFVPSATVSTDFSINSTTIVDGVAGSNVDDAYVRTETMPVTVGGASVGTSFNGTVAEALDKVLYPYVKPKFTSFLLSGQNTSLEVGDKVSGGQRTFTWATSTSENIEVDTIKITSDGVTVLENSANDGTETFDLGADIVKTTAGTQYFYIYGTDTQTTIFNRIYAVYWKWRLHYGSSSLETLTSNDVASLQSSLLYTSENYTYNTPANNYKWICYPVSFGTASKFTDMDTGFGVAMESPQILSVTNAFGVTTDYYCYRSTNSMAGAVRIKIG